VATSFAYLGILLLIAFAIHPGKSLTIKLARSPIWRRKQPRLCSRDGFRRRWSGCSRRRLWGLGW
jgi:hypothetical protein